MDRNLGTHHTQLDHQHANADLQGAFDPTTEEGIVKGLNDLVLWAPFTHVGYSAISQALVLIEHLKDCNKQISEDPYLKLRKFGEEMLNLLIVSDNAPPKQIFFYNYPNNEVYLGTPADLNQGISPMMVKATLGTEAVVSLSFDEAIAATKHNTGIIQSRVYGMPLQPEPVPKAVVDWEFTLRIDHVPFEPAFKVQFVYHLKPLNFFDPESVYEEFKDKFNLSHILNSGKRTQMDLHVFCVNTEIHWEWVKSE